MVVLIRKSLLFSVVVKALLKRVILTKGRDKGKIRLRQLQWRAAEKGNVSMLIWLGKQVLDQTDRQEITEVKPIDDVVFDGI